MKHSDDPAAAYCPLGQVVQLLMEVAPALPEYVFAGQLTHSVEVSAAASAHLPAAQLAQVVGPYWPSEHEDTLNPVPRLMTPRLSPI